MIRVNLLGVREPSAAQAPGVPAPPSEKKGVLVAILLLGGAVGFIGFRFFTARQTISQLQEEISQLTQEKARLQAIIARVNEYQKKLEELQRREALIETLKRDREGPVRMLDDLSAQLPDFVWLAALSQEATGVAISGMAASYVSIADYIQKLEASERFHNVELLDAKQDKEFTSFQLRAQVTAPAPAPAAAGQAGSVPAGPGQPGQPVTQ